MSLNICTPGQIVKEFAARNPDKIGRVNVYSLTPAGKGGWKTKRKESSFYIKAGKSASTRSKKNKYNPPASEVAYWDNYWTSSNGQCPVCNQYRLKPIIRRVYAEQPEAGKPVTEADFRGRSYNNRCFDGKKLARSRYGIYCCLDACEYCIEENGEWLAFRSAVQSPAGNWYRPDSIAWHMKHFMPEADQELDYLCIEVASQKDETPIAWINLIDAESIDQAIESASETDPRRQQKDEFRNMAMGAIRMENWK